MILCSHKDSRSFVLSHTISEMSEPEQAYCGSMELVAVPNHGIGVHVIQSVNCTIDGAKERMLCTLSLIAASFNVEKGSCDHLYTIAKRNILADDTKIYPYYDRYTFSSSIHFTNMDTVNIASEVAPVHHVIDAVPDELTVRCVIVNAQVVWKSNSVIDMYVPKLKLHVQSNYAYYPERVGQNDRRRVM